MNRNSKRRKNDSEEMNLEDEDETTSDMSSILNSTNIIFTPTDIEILPNNKQELSRSNLTNPSMNSLDTILYSSQNYVDNNHNLLLPSSNNFYFNKNDCSSPMYRSITSIAGEEDPWRASSIGIKCISYKPIGYVFLTRRVLDLYTTDGKRKVDIVYNFSKKYKNRIKTPSIGSSIENCSFCDTITIDFDPSSTLFDLIMEVQIITQGAAFERSMKLSAISKSGKEEQSIENQSVQITPSIYKPDQIEFIENLSESDEDESFVETTTITSDYDFKYHKLHGFILNQQNSDYTGKQNQIEYSQSKDSESDVNTGTQKIIVKTIIHSELDEPGTDFNSHYNSRKNLGDSLDRSRTPDLKKDLSVIDKASRSQSTSCLLGPEYRRSNSSLFSERRSNTPDRMLNDSNTNTNTNSSNCSLRSSSSRRSIITTVECIPADSNAIETFDIEEEITERQKFFSDFNKKYETKFNDCHESTSDLSSSNLSDMGSSTNLNESSEPNLFKADAKLLKTILKLSCNDAEPTNDKLLYDIDEKSESNLVTPINSDATNLFPSSDLLIETDVDLKSCRSQLLTRNNDAEGEKRSIEEVIRQFDQIERRSSQQKENGKEAETVEHVNNLSESSAAEIFQGSTGSECSGSENIDMFSEESLESLEIMNDDELVRKQLPLEGDNSEDFNDLIKSLNKLNESLSRLNEESESFAEDAEKPKEQELSGDILNKFNSVVNDFVGSNEKNCGPVGGFSKEGSPNDIKPMSSNNQNQNIEIKFDRIDGISDDEEELEEMDTKDYDNAELYEKIVLTFDSNDFGSDSKEKGPSENSGLYFHSFGPSIIHVTEEEMGESLGAAERLLEDTDLYKITVEESQLTIDTCDMFVQKPELATIESDEELITNEVDTENSLDSDVIEKITLAFDSFNSSGEQLVHVDLIEESIEEENLHLEETKPIIGDEISAKDQNSEMTFDMIKCNSNFKQLLLETTFEKVEEFGTDTGTDVNCLESALLEKREEETYGNKGTVHLKTGEQSTDLVIIEKEVNIRQSIINTPVESQEQSTERKEEQNLDGKVLQKFNRIVDDFVGSGGDFWDKITEPEKIPENDLKVEKDHDSKNLMVEPVSFSESKKESFCVQLIIEPKYDSVSNILLEENQMLKQSKSIEVCSQPVVIDEYKMTENESENEKLAECKEEPTKIEDPMGFQEFVESKDLHLEFSNENVDSNNFKSFAYEQSRPESFCVQMVLEPNFDPVRENELEENETFDQKAPTEFTLVTDVISHKLEKTHDVILSTNIDESNPRNSIKPSGLETETELSELINEINSTHLKNENKLDEANRLLNDLLTNKMAEDCLLPTITEQISEISQEIFYAFDTSLGSEIGSYYSENNVLEPQETSVFNNDAIRSDSESDDFINKQNKFETEVILTRTLEIEINEVEYDNVEETCESNELLESYQYTEKILIDAKEGSEEHDIEEEEFLDIKVNNSNNFVNNSINTESDEDNTNTFRERMLIPIGNDSEESDEDLNVPVRTSDPIQKFSFTFLKSGQLNKPIETLPNADETLTNAALCQPTKVFQETENDINILDKSRFQLEVKEIASDSAYFDLVSESIDPSYFPIYIFNESLIRKVPVNVETIERRQISTSDAFRSPAVFDIYTDCDLKYSCDFLESIAALAKKQMIIENSHLSQEFFQVPRFARETKNPKVLKSNSQSHDDYIQDPLHSSSIEKKLIDDINIFIKEYIGDREENNLISDDINLMDYSEYQLAFDKSHAYSDLLVDTEDSAYFPKYQINQKLAAKVPVTYKKNNQQIYSAKDLEIFDIYSLWDLNYSIGFEESTKLKQNETINIENVLLNSQSICQNLSQQQEHKTGNLPVLTSLPTVINLPYISSLYMPLTTASNSATSSQPSKASNVNMNESFEPTIESVENDINFIDYSKFELVTHDSLENNTFSTLFSKVDDPAYFAIYSINKSLVKKVLKKGKKVPMEVAVDSVFDIYSKWDVNYSSNYNQATKQKSIEDILLENQLLKLNMAVDNLKKDDDYGVLETHYLSRIRDNISALPIIQNFYLNANKETTEKTSATKQEIEFDTAVFDRNAQWNSDYSTGFSDSLQLKRVADFQEENKLLEPRLNDNSNVEILEIYSNQSRPTILDRLVSIPNPLRNISVKKIQDVTSAKFEEDIDIIDGFKYELVTICYGNSDRYFDYMFKTDDPAYFPIYKMNANLVRKVPLGRNRKRKVCLLEEATVFDIYCPWDVEYSSGYNESVKKRAIESTLAENKALEQNITSNYMNAPIDNLGDRQAEQKNFPLWFNLFPRNGRQNKERLNDVKISNKAKEQEATNQQQIQSSNTLVSEGEATVLSIPSTPIERFLFTLSKKMSTKKDEPISTCDQIEQPSHPTYDINLNDRAEYKLALDVESKGCLYSDLVTQSEDCCYFPVYKLNENLVKKVATAKKPIQQQQHEDLSCFDTFSEWDSTYTTDFIDTLKFKTLQEIEVENKLLKQQITEAIKSDANQVTIGTALKNMFRWHKTKPMKQAISKTLEEEKYTELSTDINLSSTPFKYQIMNSLIVRQPIELLECALELNCMNFNDKDDLRPFIIDHYKLNYYSEIFKASTLSEISSVMQNSFYRASHIYHKNLVQYNAKEEEQTELADSNGDLISTHHIQKFKPYFDDFANFISDEYEYSRYNLQINSDKLGIDMKEKECAEPLRRTNLASLFEFFAISAGALSVFLLRNS